MRALPPSRWILANAGSGKTHALIQQILRLLVMGVDPHAIVCLTYTNAAATEMRVRLASRLMQFSLLPNADLAEQLNDLLSAPPTPDEMAQSRNLYVRLLEEEPGVGFYTIHSFCERLLRTFPLEAHVPNEFTLLDDYNATQMKSEAYHLLQKEMLQHGPIADAFAWMLEQAREGHVRALVMQAAKARRSWENVSSDAQTLEHLIGALFGVDLAQDISAYFARYSSPEIIASLRDLADALAQDEETDSAQAAQIRVWLSRPSEACWQDYYTVWCTEKHTPRVSPLKPKFLKKHPRFAALMEEEKHFVHTLGSQLSARSAARTSHAIAQLTQRFLAHYAQQKLSVQALDFDDLLLKARDLLSSDTLRPWLFFKLDQKLSHILIDEAQDTSPEQWAMLNALFAELFQHGVAAHKTLLIVGDLKQSIYSFQGARPQLFAAQRPMLAGRLEASGSALISEHLDQSRRSSPLILDVVNAVCESLQATGAFITEDAFMPHHSHRTGAHGRVECWPVIEKTKIESRDVFSPPTAYESIISSDAQWADAIAERIAGWLQSGRMLAGRDRPVEPKDILILLRQRGGPDGLAALLIKSFTRRAIAVSGIDRLRLNAHLAVRDHLAFFEWCLHPYDDYHLAIALRSPLGGVSELELEQIAADRGTITLWQSLLERMPTHAVVVQFTAWREYLLSMRLTQAMQLLYADGTLMQAFATRFGAEVIEVLQAFFGEAEQFDAHALATLRAFVDYMRDNQTELRRETDSATNQVRIMTVHGAKGLESPIVILADACDVPEIKDRLFFVEENGRAIPCQQLGLGKHAEALAAVKAHQICEMYHEYYRLLYVAMTRAGDELYVGGVRASQKAPEAGKESWYHIMHHALGRNPHATQHEDGSIILSDADLRYSSDVAQKDEDDIIPAFLRQSVPKETSITQRFAPSHMRAENLSDGNALARVRGIIIHSVLQWMEHFQPESHQDITKIFQRFAPEWDAAQCSREAHALWVIYTHPDFAWVWQKTALREVGIAGHIQTPQGLMPFSGVIDRLVETPECRFVLDYKTTAHAPASLSDIDTAHLHQMLAYKMLLEADGSGKSVRCALFFTSTPSIYMLDDALDGLDFTTLLAA